MKRKIISFVMCMAMVGSIVGCRKAESVSDENRTVDICEPIVREYLEAETEEEQAALLERNSDMNFARQVATLRWERDGSDGYKVYFADNKEYQNARTYETSVATVTPEGVLVPGKTYYWKVESQTSGKVIHEESFTVADLPVRYVNTTHIPNVRDMGGWKTEDGSKVKYELLYRGGITNPRGGNVFPEEDVTFFRDTLGIKTEIDLRIIGGDDGNQTVSILGEDAAYYKTPIHPYCYIISGFHQSQPVGRGYDPKFSESIREIFHVLADADNYPIYFHCNAGADRTGTLAYLINGVLGVSYEDLTRDFELTSFSSAGRRWRGEIKDGLTFDSRGVMQDDTGNYVAWGKMNQMMKVTYGVGSLSETIENYLIKQCQVPKEDIDSLRAIMLEGKEQEAKYKQLPECSILKPDEDDERFYCDSENHIYCREDIYESVMQIIENGYEADGYVCQYFNRQEDESQRYIFSEKEMKAAEQVLKQTPMGLNEMAVKVSFPISDYMEEFPFSRHLFDLSQVRDEFYLEKFSDNGTSQFYKVPENLEPIFKKIYQICVETSSNDA